MPLFTANWTPLGRNVYYRKIELYHMEWKGQVNLSDFIIAAAQFGGPIALTRDEKKLQKVTVSGKPNIYIYSSSGLHISTIKWNSGKLVHMGWTSTEELLCIQDDGTVLFYDMHGNFISSTSMRQESKEMRVLECKIFSHHKYGTGVAVLTGTYQVYLVNNIKQPRIRKMPQVPGLDAPPSSWAVLADERNERNVKVLIAKDNQLYILDQEKDTCTQVFPEFNNPINAIIEIAVSYNNQHVALFPDTGALWLGTSNIEKKHCEFETESKTRPQQLVWCGSGAVVGFWSNILLVVGLDKDWLDYYYATSIHMVPEIDGVRIIGDAIQELLQKVPNAVADVFRIGSVSSSALLLEASKEFQRKSHKADQYMRMIREKNELEEAVNQCIKAAGHEFEPSTQKMLLRAASFGKSFIPGMEPGLFVSMCQTLRVLNAVRRNNVGLPLTYVQLQYLTTAVLIDRLILRRHYCLAIRICHYLKTPDTEGASRILAHWARYKVKRMSLDPEQTAREIAAKLENTPGISYSEIANAAMEYGHPHLSVKLLDYETRASEQVPLLIKLKQEQQAMSKAIDSGDTDLIYTVILHLKNTLPRGDFPMMIRNFPAAHALYIKLCKEQDLELLRANYLQEDDFNSQADCSVIESYQASSTERRISCLITALDMYRKAKNDFAAQHTEEQIRLMKYQVKLKEKHMPNYMDLSVHETVKELLTNREFKLAEELKKEFRVPDRRFWWLKITTHAREGDWLELEKFSRSKKSPIGYEPFVDACIKHGNEFEAMKYMPKVKDENRVKYFIKLRKLDEAAKAAFEQKDLVALNHIQRLCGVMDRLLSEKINTMKSQLQGSRR